MAFIPQRVQATFKNIIMNNRNEKSTILTDRWKALRNIEDTN